MSRALRLAIVVPAIAALVNLVLATVALAGDANPCIPILGC